MKANVIFMKDLMAIANNPNKEEVTYTVTIKRVNSSKALVYKNVIDVTFGDSVIVLVSKKECIYLRAKHVVSVSAKEE